jgi:hypothetical protein
MNLSELTVAGTSKMGYLPNAFTIEIALISSRIESALGVEETDVPGVEAPEGRSENYLKDSRPASLDAIQARTEAH